MMTDTEWRHQILEDMARLKEDVAGYLEECRKTSYDEFTSGIKCPRCGCAKSRLIDSRTENGFRRRRRKCYECDARWNTLEIGTYSGPS